MAEQDTKEIPEQSNIEPTTAGPDVFPIVGIGMSAGGLEVAGAFLRAMPTDSGMAFVIVQHLDPTRESLLTELLSRETEMPLVQVQEGMRVEPNHVYVIVPAKTLLIEDGIFRLANPVERRGMRHPIDKFFTSLAADRKQKAIAIVLTGAGSNGTAGLLDIKQAGGLCIAQDPKTAKFNSMPRHAIDSDIVDYVLAPEAMPAALLQYVQHSYITDPKPEKIEADAANGVDDIIELLKKSGIHDFRQYKRATLSRRIHRRMGLSHMEHLADYKALLETDQDELKALGKDLMINVTAFFRDPHAWNSLEQEAVTPLIEQAKTGDPIRVWVPACSTGAEAYSIAMLLIEHNEASGKALNVKIFATDAADHHLGAARKATFPGSMVEGLTPERLQRFFDKIDDNYYRIKQFVREIVLFAPQDLLQDPPYSRMDLVSCRNLLIYLQSAAQEKVLALAHFALREGGYLFLGNAETTGSHGNFFADVSKKHRIYRCIGKTQKPAISFSDWSTRDGQVQRSGSKPQLADVAIKALAKQFAPASVLIDRNYQVLHFHGVTDEFLSQPAGTPTMDLLALARDGLQMAIRTVVQKAIVESKKVTVRSTIKSAVGEQSVFVTAFQALSGEIDGALLVTFELDESTASQPALPTHSSEDYDLRHNIEVQLRAARLEMKDTVEQYETTNEELTAANEEVTSVNEELQATNEELEASKEELQALNEELSTINAQLDRKIVELGDVHDDLKNLLMGNDVATIFLDTKMNIKWFSPAIDSVFSLRNEDIGRPIANFAQKFVGGGLLEKANAAVVQLANSEIDVETFAGQTFRMRILPYQTYDNRIAGAVATFVDITDLKQNYALAKAEKDFSAAIVESVRTPLLVLNADLRIQMASAAFGRMFDIEIEKSVGEKIYDVDAGVFVPELRVLLEDMLPEHGKIDDFEVQLTNRLEVIKDLSMYARRIEGDKDRPPSILLSIEDVTERKADIRHQELMIGELSHRVKNTLAVVQSIASQSRRGSKTLDEFGLAFDGRLGALASANDLVISGSWKKVDLRHLVDRALRPFAQSGQFIIVDGPPVDLHPQSSLTVAMILHELATNATKYGALSTKAGTVSIGWRVEKSGTTLHLCFDWAESGGPTVIAPKKQGQGTRFIERSTTYELKGSIDLNYAADGMRALLQFPLA